MENQINPQQAHTGAWVTLAVFLTAIIVGGGVYAWQQSVLKKSRAEFQQQIVQNALQTANKPNTTPDLTLNNTTQPLTTDPSCTVPAVETDSGRRMYPIDPKYPTLEYLGQAFAAGKCGLERLNEVFNGDEYKFGSHIVLTKEPSINFLKTLKAIGFTCNENAAKATEQSCKDWTLEKVVPTQSILQLEPFADQIKFDDCILCG